MSITLWVILGVLVNLLVGLAVCLAIDVKQKAFYPWYKKQPILIAFLIVTFWPISAYFIYISEHLDLSGG